MKKVFLMFLAVMVLSGLMMIPVTAAPSDGEISTDKSEYLEGELIKVSYRFNSADSTKQRRINIYKGSVSDDNFVWAMSATGQEGSGHHIYFWSLPDGKAALSSPGTYIMKVVNGFNGDYGKEITSSFTVKANPNLVDKPSIALTKKVNSLEDMLQIRFNGLSDGVIRLRDEYEEDGTRKPYTLTIKIYDDVDFPVTQVLLYNGNDYLGLSGVIEFDPTELWEGDFYMLLESDDPTLDLSDTRFDFSMVSQLEEETEEPTNEPEMTPETTPETTPESTPTSDVQTQAPASPTASVDASKGDSGNTVLWIVIAVAGVLIVALAVVVVLLLKKKK